MDKTQGPLSGIRVIEAAIWQNGPLATRMLADMGADVIKVEEWGTGDPTRAAGVVAIPGTDEKLSGPFENQNRNKRTITLNLKKQEGREVLHRLVQNADVFVHNYRVGVPERLGFDYKTLSKINPKIIYAWNSGTGPEGPRRDWPIMDILGQAWSGWSSVNGFRNGPPCYLTSGAGSADAVGALAFAYGIALAVLARERFGIGQQVFTSQVGAIMMVQSMGLQTFLLGGKPPAQVDYDEPANPLWNYYEAGDGKWFALGCAQGDKYWTGLCKVVKRPDLESDPRYVSLNSRTTHTRELTALLKSIFLARPAAEWLEDFHKEGLMCSPVNDYYDLVQDPQIIANKYVEEFDHPTAGKILVNGIPVQLTKTPGTIRTAAPEFGQHTEEVLLELGLDWEEIEDLRVSEVI